MQQCMELTVTNRSRARSEKRGSGAEEARRRRGAVNGIAGRLERVYAVLKVRKTAGRPQEVPGARKGNGSAE